MSLTEILADAYSDICSKNQSVRYVRINPADKDLFIQKLEDFDFDESKPETLGFWWGAEVVLDSTIPVKYALIVSDYYEGEKPRQSVLVQLY